MEQTPVKLKCIVTFDSPTDTWKTTTELPVDVESLLPVIQNLRQRLHFAASLFTSPADVIAALAELFPIFANAPKGDEPIVRGVQIGQTFVQVELFVEGKQSTPATDAVMMITPPPVDCTAPKLLFDVKAKITMGSKVIAKESWAKLPIATIAAKYFRMLHSHLDEACMEDNVPGLLLDALDLFIAIEDDQLTPGDHHVNIGSHVIALSITTNALPQTPTPATPVAKFLH